jgi:hypothetical protein
MMFFRWIATAAAAVALCGCGGQDGDAGTAAAPVTAQVQVDTVPAGLRVTKSLVGQFVPSADVQEITQYTFNATISSGPDAGQNLSGTLVLQASRSGTGGLFLVEGTLFTTASLAATTGTLATFDNRVNSLRATLRARVDAATADLLAATKADAAAGLSAEDPRQSLVRFGNTVTALGNNYRTEVAALKAQLLAESADGESAPPDADTEARGTSSAKGNIRLELGDPLLQVNGTTSADGNMSGTLAGSGVDIGTWTAVAQPMPAAAAIGNITAGLAKYGTYCANCHTDNVRRNTLNVATANDVARLNAALAGIGSMTFLDPVLSAQDRLDIVAYILSAR